MIDSLAAKAKESEKRYLGAIKKAKVISQASQNKIEAVRRVPVTNSAIDTTCEAQLSTISDILKASR